MKSKVKAEPQSQLLHFFTEMGAKVVAPDYASLEAMQGLPRFAADLGDYPKAQPLALLILTRPGESAEPEYIVVRKENQMKDFGFAHDEPTQDSRTAYAIELDGFSSFLSLRHNLTAAFNADAAAGLMDNVAIAALYMPPEIAPARVASAHEFTKMALHLESEAMPLAVLRPKGRGGWHL